jgi:acyl carrier protein
MYGPTETTIWSTTARVRGGVAPSLGAPIANTSIHVLDQWLRPVAIGTPGEICIGGDGVARGYRGQPALTAAKFVAIPGRSDGARLYRTGDVGCLHADATLHYLGRSDDQIKIRGVRVEPAEIEAALADCPGVRQAAVIPHRAGHDDIRLVAFVRSDDADGGADQYRRQIAARLPGYMMPSAFVRVETLPLTPNGKINRQALSGAAAEAVSAPSLGCEPPRTPLERELAAIWAQVLGTPEVGVGTSFFELGGHSLLAATVIARVESAYQVTLPLNLFYTAPSVAEHACYIERLLVAPQAPTPEEYDRLLAMIEGLSDTEAAAYLRSLDAAQQGEEL